MFVLYFQGFVQTNYVISFRIIFRIFYGMTFILCWYAICLFVKCGIILYFRQGSKVEQFQWLVIPCINIFEKKISSSPSLSLTIVTHSHHHHPNTVLLVLLTSPDSKIHGAKMWPTWVLSAPEEPHDGPMNLAIRVCLLTFQWVISPAARPL